MKRVENKNENAATMVPGGFMVMGVLKCLNFSIYCEDTELDHMKNRTGRTAHSPEWEKQEILQAFGLNNCGYDSRFYGGEETWERTEFGGKNQEFSFVHIALEMPLHVGVVGVGHGNMELRRETGVGVIMAVLIIQMVFMSHAGTY